MTPISDIALLLALLLAAIWPVAVDDQFIKDHKKDNKIKGENELGDMEFKPRIVGGRPANIISYPYVVSVQVSNTHACGGSIVSKDFVLTAAHCFFNPMTHHLWSLKQLSVLAGSSVSASSRSLEKMQLTKSIQRRGVKRCLPAPGHDPWKEGTGPDIGLIEVDEPFEWTRWVRLAPLLTDEEDPTFDMVKRSWSKGIPPPGTVCQTMGWGHVRPVPTSQQTVEGAQQSTLRPSVVLNVVELPILSFDKCREYYETLSEKEHICTLAKGKDACNGDSGGPMICDGQQVAIVMAGDGCAQPGAPGAFTLIRPHRDWIFSIINKKDSGNLTHPDDRSLARLSGTGEKKERSSDSTVSRLDCRCVVTLVLLISLLQASI